MENIPVIDAALPSFVIDIEVLQVVVEVDRAGAEVATEEGGMGREHGRHIDMTLPAERDGDAGLPLMEVGDDRFREIASYVL